MSTDLRDSHIDCVKCAYFYITWDKSFPRGCRLFGFKTSSAPCLAVLEATGAACRNYTAKQTTQKTY